MELKFDNIFESIIVVGDVHGEIKALVNKVNSQYRIKNSLIIVAGDVGLGFHKPNYDLDIFKKVNPQLKKSNNILLLLRGNHDKKDIWLDSPLHKQYWQTGNENIRLLKDYTVISAKSERGDVNILCVGGAISVDRQQRTVNKDYWVDEPFVYEEDKVKDLQGITHVITHSAPDFCQPISKGGIHEWIRNDYKLAEDTDNERKDHTRLYNKLSKKNTIKKWFYGHFHWSNFGEYNGTIFKLLDIMELNELI